MSETFNFNGSGISAGTFIGNSTGISVTASNVQVFQGPGAPVITGGTFTWVKPTTGAMVLIECWGGGGGGGEYGGGGGGGGYNYGIFPMTIFPGPAIVTVGDGGICPQGRGPAPVYASPGGNSNVSLSPTSNLVTGWGGGGGGAGDYGANAGAVGGGGGMASAGGSGTTGLQGGGPASHGLPAIGHGLIYGGGAGGAGSGVPTVLGCTGGSSTYGGGGGGGYRGPGPQSTVPGGTSIFGGAGGRGRNLGSPATPGLIPGGGGGAGSQPTGVSVPQAGCPGASGQVRITTF